ncbi:MAG: response regulator [Calditrichaeota bacterium]|nr:MAG: response regulator [Calditrichota bacterium]
MRVLIADDENISRKLLKRSLERWGHQVFEARNGREALQLLQEEDISLVVTDWMMPDVDGLQLVKEIRALPNRDYIYIILLTAKTMKEDLIEGMEAGADDFIAKPFDREELRVRLRAGERLLKLERTLSERNRELETMNRRMKRDLAAAARIQQSLLPRNVPQPSQLEIAWKYRPCDELAGDTLNILPLPNNQVGLYLLDVSGHGVPAALMAVALSHLLTPSLNGQAGQLNRHLFSDPGKLATHLNASFQTDEEQEQFFTLVYGVVDVKKGSFAYASAGHPDLIYLPRDGQPQRLGASGLPIGFSPVESYRTREIALNPGDRFIMYSDGIPEARNAAGEQFGKERFVEILNQCKTEPLDRTFDAIISAVQTWTADYVIEDDMSLLGFEFRP